MPVTNDEINTVIKLNDNKTLVGFDLDAFIRLDHTGDTTVFTKQLAKVLFEDKLSVDELSDETIAEFKQTFAMVFWISLKKYTAFTEPDEVHFRPNYETICQSLERLSHCISMPHLFEIVFSDLTSESEEPFIKERVYDLTTRLAAFDDVCSYTNKYKINSLQMAVLHGAVHTVNALLDAGADVLHLSDYGQTPLSVIANNCAFQRKYDTNTRHSSNQTVVQKELELPTFTPIFTAILQSLPRNGSINKSNESADNIALGMFHLASPGYETALSSAIFNDKLDSANRLILYGANIDAIVHSATHTTALHWACSNLSTLLEAASGEKDADGTYKLDDSKTAQVISVISSFQQGSDAQKSYARYIDNLIKLKASLTVKDAHDHRPLDYLSVRAKEALEEAGIKITHVSTDSAEDSAARGAASLR